MDTKPAYQSKTLWTNLILALTAILIPGVNAWVVAHPDYVVYVFAAVNMALRFLTKGKIELT